jgi:hypothetical protein
LGKKVIIHRPPGVEVEVVDAPNASKVEVVKKEKSYDHFWEVFHKEFDEHFVEKWDTYHYRPFYHRAGQFLVVEFAKVPKKKGSCRIVVLFPHRKERASMEFALRQSNISKVLAFVRKTYIEYYQKRIPDLAQKITEAQEKHDTMKSLVKGLKEVR